MTDTATLVRRDARRTKVRRSDLRAVRAQERAAWVLSAPFLLILVVFSLVPLAMALVVSLTDTQASDLRSLGAVNFVALESYSKVMSDPAFQGAMLNTGVMTVIGVPLTVGAGMLLALALNTGIQRLRATYRAAFYLPVVTNIVAAAVIWQYAFTIDGPVNSALAVFGLGNVNWLGSPSTATGLVIVLASWRNVGTAMILFLAGLQAIPQETYEAAAMDGAGFWRNLWSITMPLLRPTMLLASVLITITYLNIFDEPFLLTRGGPTGSTRTVGLWVYEQFGFGNISNAMAGSFLLIAFVALISVVQVRMLRSKT